MKKIILSLTIVFIICGPPAFSQRGQKAAVLAFSKKVVLAIKARNMSLVATYSHPVKGVRFSPYSEIDLKDDQTFKPSQIKGLMKSKKIYLWGYYDESERPIRVTFAKYYRQFVYDRNYVRADEITYNLKQNMGIMVTNIPEIYPKGVEVPYCFEGTDQRMYACMRLIYEKYRSKWYLIAAVRDTPGI